MSNKLTCNGEAPNSNRLHSPTIWVITVFTQASVTDSGEFCGGSQRTWGFYFNRADALAALETNMTDLFETCYHWAVLEEYEPGIDGILPASTQWFKYDEERDGYFFDRTKTTQMANRGAFAMGVVIWKIKLFGLLWPWKKPK